MTMRSTTKIGIILTAAFFIFVMAIPITSKTMNSRELTAITPRMSTVPDLISGCLYVPKYGTPYTRSWDFENASLSGWTLGKSPNNPTISSAYARSGTYSVKIMANGAGTQSYMWQPYDANISNVSAWMKFPTALSTLSLIFNTLDPGDYTGFHESVKGQMSINSNATSILVQIVDGANLHNVVLSDPTGWHRYEIDTNGSTSNYIIDGVLRRAGCAWQVGGSGNPAAATCIEFQNAVSTEIAYVDDVSVTTLRKIFVTGSTLFTIAALDIAGYGVTSTSYKIWDNTTNTEIRTWGLYSTPFTLGSSTNGSYTIIFDSLEGSLYNESLLYCIVFIDTTTPATTLNYTASAPPNFVTTSTIFTLTVVETGSGVNHTWYKYTGIVWTIYSAPFTLTNGTTGNILIQYYTNDNVGHNETVHSITVYMNIVYGVHVHMHYHGPGGVGDYFNDLLSYVDSKQVYDPDFTIASPCVFNLTVKNLYYVTVYSSSLNTNTTGTDYSIAIPIYLVRFINRHDFTINVTITQGHITTSSYLSKISDAPNNEQDFNMVLGTYTVNEYAPNGTRLIGVNESRIAVIQTSVPESFTIRFGWTTAQFGIPPATPQELAIIWGIMIGSIGGVAIVTIAIGSTIHRRSRRNSNDESNSPPRNSPPSPPRKKRVKESYIATINGVPTRVTS